MREARYSRHRWSDFSKHSFVSIFVLPGQHWAATEYKRSNWANLSPIDFKAVQWRENGSSFEGGRRGLKDGPFEYPSCQSTHIHHQFITPTINSFYQKDRLSKSRKHFSESLYHLYIPDTLCEWRSLIILTFEVISYEPLPVCVFMDADRRRLIRSWLGSTWKQIYRNRWVMPENHPGNPYWILRLNSWISWLNAMMLL